MGSAATVVLYLRVAPELRADLERLALRAFKAGKRSGRMPPSVQSEATRLLASAVTSEIARREPEDDQLDLFATSQESKCWSLGCALADGHKGLHTDADQERAWVVGDSSEESAERYALAPEQLPAKAKDIKDGVVFAVRASELAAVATSLPGVGKDKVKLAKARAAILAGQERPIVVNVSPKGRLDIEDGRHRLAAAADLGAPILVKWQRGSAGLDAPPKKAAKKKPASKRKRGRA